jgi:hypothetical protein
MPPSPEWSPASRQVWQRWTLDVARIPTRQNRLVDGPARLLADPAAGTEPIEHRIRHDVEDDAARCPAGAACRRRPTAVRLRP